MGRREENKKRVREEILRTALDWYRTKGFDETRVQDIIEQVGISEKTFFNYFPSKQAVLDAVAAEQTDLYLALLDYELALEDRSVRDRLLEIVRSWAETFSTDREFQATVVGRTPMFFGSTGSARTQQRDTQRRLGQLLAQGQEQGEIRRDADPLQLAEMLSANLMLTTINWLDRWWGESDESLEDRLERALVVFLDGAAGVPAPEVRARAGGPRR